MDCQSLGLSQGEFDALDWSLVRAANPQPVLAFFSMAALAWR